MVVRQTFRWIYSRQFWLMMVSNLKLSGWTSRNKNMRFFKYISLCRIDEDRLHVKLKVESFALVYVMV